LASFTVLFALIASFTVIGFKFFLIPKSSKGILVAASLKDNVTAIATVTTVWSAFSDIFFMTKTKLTIATIASSNDYFGFVYKNHTILRLTDTTWIG
jgi:hypothetical protein